MKMDAFPQINKGQERILNKEELGIEFEKILKMEAERYDQTLSAVTRNIGGEELVQAMRGKFILVEAVKKFTKIEGFPKERIEEIRLALYGIESNNPSLDQITAYTTSDESLKIASVENFEIQLNLYRQSVLKLYEILEKILPDRMYLALLVRNDMFVGLLKFTNDYFTEK